MKSGHQRIKEILEMIESRKILPEEGYRIIKEIRGQEREHENRNGFQMHADNDVFEKNVFKRDINNVEVNPVKMTDNPMRGTDFVTGIYRDSKFKTVILNRPGNIEDISILPAAPSQLQDNEVQILVKAFSLNFGDLLCVKGLYPSMPEYPFTPGFEVAGVVVRTGRDVTRLKVGDEVVGLTGFKMGGHSFIINTPENMVAKKPANVSFEEACAFPIVFITIYHVFEKAMIEKGEKVLIQTASGGTGLIAVQIALQKGAEVFATASTSEKLEYLKNMGVHHLINYHKEDFAERIMDITGGYGVDAVINTLSGDAIQKGLDILAPGGRYLEIAMTGLKTSGNLNLSKLIDNQTFYSIDLRRLMLKQGRKVTKYLDVMSEYLLNGNIKPTVGRVFPFSQIKESYRYMENRGNIGKIVVKTPLTERDIDEYIAGKPHNTKFLPGNNTLGLNNQASKDIAIIGASCRFPGAANIDEFWQNIANGKCLIKEVPKDRWDADKYYDPDVRRLDKTNCKWGGFLEDIDKFDPLFFNISVREAELTDPQQRLFLETCWSALEDAGYANESVSNSKCSVFVGVSNGDYLNKMSEEGISKEPQSFWGNASSVSAARISYLMNLKGPSVAIDTACSSSLVGIHLGCQSIINGESDMVIAGGVFVAVTPGFYIACSNAGMLSPDGKSLAFDNDANGFIPGEGVGAVVLKSYEKAIEDGDHIYGVIKSIGINQDGKTNGITAPSTLSQTDLEVSVYEKGNINPENISYIETHGTGTKLGDPIEIEALTNAFRKYTNRNQFCAVGSVKTNIGHAVTAAGVASVIKVIMALKYKKIPPYLNFKKENEHINFKESPFYVNTELTDWKISKSQTRMAAISSFGFSGTNAHLIIEEFVDSRKKPFKSSKPYYLAVFSAKNEDALNRKLSGIIQWLEKEGDAHSLEDMCYTLGVGRSHFNIRAALIVKDVDELLEKLKSVVAGQPEVSGFFRNSREIRSTLNGAQRQDGVKVIVRLKSAQGDEIYKEELINLADLYINCGYIDWNALYQGEGCKRISMPTYPFVRKTCWFSDKNSTVEFSKKGNLAEKLHPLLHQNTSTLEEQQFTNVFSGNEFYLEDHIIGNEKVLPGVAYLEFARVAGDIAGNKRVRKLRKIVWGKPISITGNGFEAKIVLYPSDDMVDYEVFSCNGEERTLHNQGSIEFEKHREIDILPEYFDVEEIRQRCSNTVNGTEFYSKLGKRGLFLGPAFQVIEEAWGNETECLSILELPQKVKVDANEYWLHPSFMDAAFQTALISVNGEKLYIPFSINEIEILERLDTVKYAYAVKVSSIQNNDSTLARFDVCLLDDQGKVLVKIKEFLARPVNVAVSSINPVTKTDASDRIYFKKIWRTDEERQKTLLPDGYIMVMDKDERLFDLLKENLEKQGRGSKIILVKAGNGFVCENDLCYELKPSQEEDYIKLIDTLKKLDKLPDYIINCWPLNSFNNEVSEMSFQLENGFYPILFLSKALLSQKIDRQIILLHTYQETKGMSVSFNKAVAGFGRTLLIENSKLVLKTLGLNNDERTEISGDNAKTMLYELGWGTEYGVEILCDNGNRRVRVLEEFKLVKSEPVLKKYGVYLVTGGLGGIGSIVSKYLASVQNAKIILTGRTALTPDRMDRIKELEALGGEAIYVQADISSKDEVCKLITKAKECFGGLNGIIHCAGINKDALIINKSKEDVLEVLSPKVPGTIWLDEETKNEELDFFAMFSSTAAVMGNAGQSDYAYANCFMDSFAEYREELRLRGERKGKTLSINWPLWENGGMKVSEQTAGMLEKSFGMKPLSAEGGVSIFTECLEQDECVLMAMEGDLYKIRKIFGQKGEEKKSRAAHVKCTEARIDDEELLDKIQQDLKEMVADIIKISEIDIYLDEEMSEFGFDSLSLTDFSNKLNERFDLGIMPSVFFEYPTLSAFAKYVVEEHRDILVDCYNKDLKTVDISIEDEENENLNSVQDTIPRSRFVESKGQKTMIPYEEVMTEPIAIVGMSGVMPQSDNLEEFWINLVREKDLITEVPSERWNWKEWYGDPVLGGNKTNVKWGGFMREVDKFDTLFFGISPKEAEVMDPQQRIVMETVWKTIEDAGYKASQLSGTKTGLFMGVASSDYGDLLNGNVEIQAQTSTGMSHCILVNRLSYLLNIHGPSEPIDTACSSSLVAVHRAIESIRNGDCDMAIAGGVNVMVSPKLYISFNKAGMLCEDGRCKTFDSSANGYVRGEGVGAVLLKPLSKAKADKDHIYAVIKGSSVNHGGRSNSLTAPNPNAQAELISRAWEKAKVDPATITYIEAHGTGTSLGDPIEINGLKKAFEHLYSLWDKPAPLVPHCGVGSVKTNIGHLETAAGIAGLIKLILGMKHGKIPASINFKELNPYIKLKDSPLYIVTSTVEWKRLKDRHNNEIPRRAGVSSFGFGGVNAHVAVEEYMESESELRDSGEEKLFVLSAKNSERLKEYASSMADFIEKYESDGMAEKEIALAVAYTLQMGREEMEERLAVVSKDIDGFRRRLREYCDNDSNIEGLYIGTVNVHKKTVLNPETAKEVEESMVNSNYAHLAELWVSGASIDWIQLYKKYTPRRVSLPTYPFAKEHFWVQVSSGSFSSSTGTEYRLHPLIHRNISTLKEECFMTKLTGNEFFLNDHKINGQKLLPGVAYIEMARAAGAFATEETVCKIRDIIWSKPFIAYDESESISGREIFVALFPNGTTVDYEVSAPDEKGVKVVHSKGSIEFSEDMSRNKKVEWLDISAVKERCNLTESSDGCYKLFEAAGLNYGDGFRAIKELYHSNDECIARVELPAHLGNTFIDYELHPSLMDAAFQTVIGLMANGTRDIGAPYLPFSVDELEILGSIPKKCYTYVQEIGNISETNVKRYNIKITDLEGEVIIIIRGFMTLRYQTELKSINFTEGGSSSERSVEELLKRLENGELNADEVNKMMEVIYG